METKTLDPNAIDVAADFNSGIKHTTGVYADINYPTLIFTITPTPEAETNNEHKDSEYYDDDKYKVEEVELPEEDTSDLISI